MAGDHHQLYTGGFIGAEMLLCEMNKVPRSRFAAGCQAAAFSRDILVERCSRDLNIFFGNMEVQR